MVVLAWAVAFNTSTGAIHPKWIETLFEAKYTFGLCNILWQCVPEFNYALCVEKEKKPNFLWFVSNLLLVHF